jgi:hypothetical protein
MIKIDEDLSKFMAAISRSEVRTVTGVMDELGWDLTRITRVFAFAEGEGLAHLHVLSQSKDGFSRSQAFYSTLPDLWS